MLSLPVAIWAVAFAGFVPSCRDSAQHDTARARAGRALQCVASLVFTMVRNRRWIDSLDGIRVLPDETDSECDNDGPEREAGGQRLQEAWSQAAEPERQQQREDLARTREAKCAGRHMLPTIVEKSQAEEECERERVQEAWSQAAEAERRQQEEDLRRFREAKVANGACSQAAEAAGNMVAGDYIQTPEQQSLEQVLISEGLEILKHGQALQGPCSYIYDPRFINTGAPQAAPPDVQQPSIKLITRDLPVVGGRCPRRWNLEVCRERMRCRFRGCCNYHTNSEKRCREFLSKAGCLYGDKCRHLHVHPHQVKQMLAIDLECTSAASEVHRCLEAASIHERATYVRLIVRGFSVIRAQILKSVLHMMPLVHEIVLPDRLMENNLFISLITVLEDCAHKNPRLCEVVFADGSAESIWS